MDPLLIIGVCVFLYFSLRKHGNLKFKLKDEHKWIATSYVEELIKVTEPYIEKISYTRANETDEDLQKCYEMRISISYKMKDYLSDILTSDSHTYSSFPRNSIHDLEIEILQVISDRYNNSNQSLCSDLSFITTDTFKRLIESYDSRKKNW